MDQSQDLPPGQELRENTGNPNYFPTFIKFAFWLSDSLERFPALAGQLFFYACYIGINAILNLTIGTDITDYIALFFFYAKSSHALYFSVLDFGVLEAMSFIYFPLGFLMGVGMNKLIFALLPGLRRSSKTKLLVISLIVGFVSLWFVGFMIISFFLSVRLGL